MKRKREELQALTAAARQVECPAFDMNADDAQNFFDEMIAPELEEVAKRGKTTCSIVILRFEITASAFPKTLSDIDMLCEIPITVAGCEREFDGFAKGHPWANELADWFLEMRRYETDVISEMASDIIDNYRCEKTRLVQKVLMALAETWDGVFRVNANETEYVGNRFSKYTITLDLRFSWKSNEEPANVQAARARVAECRKKLRVAERDLQDVLYQV